jgi:hypothetical protein
MARDDIRTNLLHKRSKDFLGQARDDHLSVNRDIETKLDERPEEKHDEMPCSEAREMPLLLLPPALLCNEIIDFCVLRFRCAKDTNRK